jgi:hypothetical protein
MLERAQVRMLPTVNRVADNAPMVGVCCNVCRTCTTMNAVSLALAAGVGALAAVAHFARRLLRRG